MQTESMKSVSDIFYYNLNRLMEEHGYNQIEFSEAIGISPATINLYANGKRFPGPENIQRLSDFFKVPPSDLFKTPAELIKERNHAISSGESLVVGNTSNVSALILGIKEYVANGHQSGFSIDVTSEIFYPYASRGDVVFCRTPNAVVEGQMVLVEQAGSILMGRVYENKQGYLLVSEKNASFPLVINKKNNYSDILAVVVSCKHTF